MCPSSDFKWKTKFTIVILTKNGFQKFHTFYSKLLSKIWIFIWNLLRGTWKGFSFDVYMPFITIFIKIKQPFAWHIYFLVRHLRRYSAIYVKSFGCKGLMIEKWAAGKLHQYPGTNRGITWSQKWALRHNFATTFLNYFVWSFSVILL